MFRVDEGNTLILALTLTLSRERERGLDSRCRGNDGGLCVSSGLMKSGQLHLDGGPSQSPFVLSSVMPRAPFDKLRPNGAVRG